MEKITKRSAIYSIPVECILLFKLELIQQAPTVSPMCARPFTGFIERRGTKSQVAGFSALGLLFWREVGAAMFYLLYHLLFYLLLKRKMCFKNASNFNFSFISVAVLYFSRVCGTFACFLSSHTSPHCFSLLNPIHHDLLSHPPPQTQANIHNFLGFPRIYTTG